MSAIEDRERAVFIDVSRAVSSADAVRQLEDYLEQSNFSGNPGATIDINTGELLLTPGVISKMKAAISRHGVNIETLYSSVPQTQQSALDEGFFVRQHPPAPKRFDTFVAEAFKDLDLPFEKNTEKQPQKPYATRPEPVSRLSVTMDDGTREEIRPLQNLSTETLFYKQTLRSGQVLEAAGNVVVIGDAHSGSEILADGDILIWGFLGGIAHAGRSGDNRAEIRAVRIEAVQLRIGTQMARRPDKLFKHENKRRGPEVAKIINGEIQIFEDIVER
jgi:septum site-determining protein MinC